MTRCNRHDQEMWYTLNGLIDVWKYESNPEAQFCQKEYLAIFEKIAKSDEQLYENYQILKRVLIDGYTEIEVAEMLGITETEIKSIMINTIKTIKEKLGE